MLTARLFFLHADCSVGNNIPSLRWLEMRDRLHRSLPPSPPRADDDTNIVTP